MCLVMILFCNVTSAAQSSAVQSNDDTLLMFVGQKLSVVTAASRRPESPSSAPAVVNVVTRKIIEQRGYRTLGELLSFESGFYVSGAARGSIPYLRGLPESILFLYNGIPMPSGGTKSVHPLDYELSLDSVEQVEIIRGPGSVLWGSDAFAGIVNIVPMGPEDMEKATVKIVTGSNDEKSIYAAGIIKNEIIETFLSVRKLDLTYHNKNYNIYSVNGAGAIEASNQKVDSSDYLEVTAKGSLSDWLAFTGRISDFTREYTVEDGTGLRWKGTKETPVSFVGLSSSVENGRSHFGFSTYYQNLSFSMKDMNTQYQETLDEFYGEILWDRRIFKKGLLTAGASYKESRVTGALAGAEFDPAEVLRPFPLFVQEVDQTDYNTRVKSAFAQYRHQQENIGFWAGTRLDSHSVLSTHLSWNGGVNWDATEFWQFKAVIGTAYRTPYSQQISQGISEQADEIETFSLQVKWRPSDRFEMDLTTFCNSVAGYISSDPNAGVSDSAEQDILGVELSAKARAYDMDFFVNMSGLTFKGDNYHFKVEDFSLVNPDGTIDVFYDRWQEPFETAPKFMIKAGIFRQITDDLGVSLTGTYVAPIRYSYSMDTVSGSYSDYWVVNSSVMVKDVLFKGSGLRLGVRNLFDEAISFSGYYGPVPGSERTWFVEWSMKW